MSSDPIEPPLSPAPPVARSTTGDSPHEPPVRPWELELLISGAVTFALLQVPRLLDAWVADATPRLDRNFLIVVMVLSSYGKMILYALIGGFSIHLAARAYWVGLIGLESVFPEGVKWDGTRYGPALREVYGSRLGRLQPVIDRVDRFCSVIFSVAFSLVMVFVFSVFAVGTISAISVGVSRGLLGGRYLGVIYFGLLTLFMVFSTGVTLVDKHLGPRMNPEGKAARMMRRAAVVIYYISGTPLFGTVWMTLYSNLSRRVFFAGMYTALFGLMAFTLLADFGFGREGVIRSDSYLYLPDAGSRSLSPEHYETLRSGKTEDGTVPSIQSDVVTGPYLKLFIPYSPRRLNQVIPERCPGVGRADRSFSVGVPDTVPAAAQDSVLACLARLQPVRLNGRPVAPSFRFYRHPGTDVRGIIAYLPTAALPPGENLLEVGAVPRPRGDKRPPRLAYRIPFWR